MSDGATIGPLFLDLEGLAVNEEERQILQRPAVGGVILFSRNVDTVDQVKSLVQQIRQIRPELLIAVDQEGGRVQRLRDGFTQLPPLAALGDLYLQQPQLAVSLARDTGWLLAAELLAVGIDFSFAPVVDIDRGLSQVIGDRSFGNSAELVIELAAAMMAGMQEAGMATTLKHFPGHGWVVADSHVAVPVDERSLEEITATDLQPFRALVSEAQAVMPAHVIYSSCDSAPAGFSSYWLQQRLRQDLGFQGVIFSDDLTMEGASVAGGFPQRVEQALHAGCTMVLICNQPEGAREALSWLEDQGYDQCPEAAQMRAKNTVDWEQLQQTPRWGQTRKHLQQLMAEYKQA